MQRISNFSLARHDGPYESWPTKTPLLFDGDPVGISLPGFQLEAQYRCDAGFLILTDWDCPFDEMNEVILLDATYRRISRYSIPNLLVHAHWPIGDMALRVHFIEQICYDIFIEPPRGWLRRKPWVRVTQVEMPERDPRTNASMEALRTDLDNIRKELNRTQPKAQQFNPAESSDTSKHAPVEHHANSQKQQ